MARAELRAGETVLAGGSGVGSAAIQIAKLLGARVLGDAEKAQALLADRAQFGKIVLSL